MKELIHIEDHRSRLHCDDPKCGHDLPEGSVTWGPHLIGYPCPECGSDMLLQEDYETSESAFKMIGWVNKWFGWLGSEFKPDEKAKYAIRVKHRKGAVTIMRDQP